MSSTAANVAVSIGAAGNIILFLAQTPMIIQMLREGDAAKYTWLPSVTLLGTMSLWGGYTIFTYSPTERADLYAGNLSGVAIPFLYLAAFVYCSHGWRQKAKIAAVTLVCLIVTWGFSIGLFASATPNATNISGGVTTFVNLTFFFSPLKAIYTGIKELDGSRLPVTMSIVQVFQSLPWVVAGILINDYFICGVNATGEVFALLQLAGVAFISLRRRQLGLKPGQPAPWMVEGGAGEASSAKAEALPADAAEEAGKGSSAEAGSGSSASASGAAEPGSSPVPAASPTGDKDNQTLLAVRVVDEGQATAAAETT